MFDSTVSNGFVVVIKETDNGGVHFDNVLFTVFIIEVGNFFCKSALFVNGIDKGNMIIFAGPVVIFTECGGGVNNADTLIRAYIIGCNNFESRAFEVFKVGEQRFIFSAHKVRAFAFFDNNGLFTKDFWIFGEDICAGDKDFFTCIYKGVVKIFAYRKTQVRRKCPGSCSPCKEINGFAVDNFICLEFGDNPSVLTGTGRVGFSRIGDRERSFTMSAVRGYTVISVNKPLVIALFESPHNTFHKSGVHCLVSTVIIYPASHHFNVFFPGFIVARNDFIALVIEFVNTERVFNDILVIDAELNFCLIFYRQTVTVPAPYTGNFIATHGLITCNHVFDKRYKDSAVMRFACGERRSVIKDLFTFSLFIDRLFKDLVFFPEIKNVILNFRNIRFACKLFVFHSFNHPFFLIVV